MPSIVRCFVCTLETTEIGGKDHWYKKTVLISIFYSDAPYQSGCLLKNKG